MGDPVQCKALSRAFPKEGILCYSAVFLKTAFRLCKKFKLCLQGRTRPCNAYRSSVRQTTKKNTNKTFWLFGRMDGLPTLRSIVDSFQSLILYFISSFIRNDCVLVSASGSRAHLSLDYQKKEFYRNKDKKDHFISKENRKKF